jgi:hypothetical protein
MVEMTVKGKTLREVMSIDCIDAILFSCRDKRKPVIARSLRPGFIEEDEAILDEDEIASQPLAMTTL